jgi:geranylgeranylglycerol-phosphate geranylgeranyltransferase
MSLGRFMPHLVGVVRLLRLSNSLPASGLVLIGAWLVQGWPLDPRAWLAAAAMWCITAFGYASNDRFDALEDSINPDRPLPAGLVTPAQSIMLAMLLALGGVSFSLPLGNVPTVVALLVLALLTFYNVRLKGTPWVGNLLIALLAGCTLLTGGVAVAGLHVGIIRMLTTPAVLLAAFVAARELLKTLEDVVGDQAAGKLTIATRLGTRPTLRVIAVLGCVVAGLGAAAWWWQGHSLGFLVVLGSGVVAPLLFAPIYLWQDAHPARVSRCLALLKASYFAGMLALLVAH